MSTTYDEPDYRDHDPVAPSAAALACAEASYLAAIASTPADHPDYARKYRPMDLRAVKDT